MPNRHQNWIRAMEQESKWGVYEPTKAQIESAARRAMPREIRIKPSTKVRWATAVGFLFIAFFVWVVLAIENGW